MKKAKAFIIKCFKIDETIGNEDKVISYFTAIKTGILKGVDDIKTNNCPTFSQRLLQEQLPKNLLTAEGTEVSPRR